MKLFKFDNWKLWHKIIFWLIVIIVSLRPLILFYAFLIGGYIGNSYLTGIVMENFYAAVPWHGTLD